VELIRIAILATIGLVLAASVWVLIDAGRRRVPTRGNTYKANTGAFAWFLGSLLLWPVVLPMYLARRKLWCRRQKQAAAFSEAEKRALRLGDAPVETHAAISDTAVSRDNRAIVAAQRLGGFDTVQLAPNLPAWLLRGLIVGPIELGSDELLLAVIDPTLRMQTKRSWAVTTRRVVSCDPRRGNPTASTAETLKACEDDLEPVLADALGQFLGVIRDEERAESQRDRSLPAPFAELAARLLPDLANQSERIRTEHRAVHEFRAALRVETPYVLVTPAISLACLGVFLAMVWRGVSAVSPDASSLVDWGAMFGLRVALDHEYWRLFTGMFLHVGFVHLLFNLVYLAWLGPTIERFFGHLTFAAIYLLSGMGGALASMAVHPTLAAAGASGAIFGVFGAIVGFLAARRRSVPRAILTPLVVAALAFITSSLIAGIFEPRIDLAAHLGGLATGLVCGLLLWRRLPAVPGKRGLVRRLAVVSALCVALAVSARAVSQAVAGEPEVLAIIKQRKAGSYNRLAESIQLPMMRFAVMRYEVERVLLSGTLRREPFGNYFPIEHSAETVQAFRALSTDDDDLRPILDAVVAAVEEIGGAAVMIKEALDAEEARLPKSHPAYWKKADHEWLQKLWDDTEKPVRAKFEAGTLAMDEAIALRDQYLKEHGFEASLAHIEAFRALFREEEARVREAMGLKPSERMPSDERLRREFRQRMSDWELRMLQVAWSLLASKDEPSGKAAIRDSR
jgi:membrane associated rhomboid family serine protease